MPLSLVVAKSRNNVIGKGSEIPWQVRGEQKLFKRITMGGTLVMGRKTFESIGRALPGRVTIVVSRNPEYAARGCTVSPSLEHALRIADRSDRPVFIVGGGEIYRQSIEIVDEMHISTIQAEVEGDIFFPDFPSRDFTLVSEQYFESNIDYEYQHLQRTRVTE